MTSNTKEEKRKENKQDLEEWIDLRRIIDDVEILKTLTVNFRILQVEELLHRINQQG